MVQVAHVAGWGAYDYPTDAALGALADAAAADSTLAARLYIDVSGADITGATTLSGEPIESLVTIPEGPGLGAMLDKLDALPAGHVLFGSDWPTSQPRAYAIQIDRAFERSERHRSWLSNRAPWMDASSPDGTDG